MPELDDNSLQLVVTSPPYFNVKDYGPSKGNIGAMASYAQYLDAVRKVFCECYRVLDYGRYCCVNISDIISEKHKYPIPAHYVAMLEDIGFTYRDDIIWKKPKGVGANGASGAAKRFGVFMQNPWPMYYYPNNIYEHILVFRKGNFDFKKLTAKKTKKARIDIATARGYIDCDIWEFAPQKSAGGIRHPAMFPDILPETLINLFTYKDETVLDPFLGSGTTSKVARALGRNSVGYEINLSYLSVMKRKIGFDADSRDIKVIVREAAAFGSDIDSIEETGEVSE
jgi:DNA modification methylase